MDTHDQSSTDGQNSDIPAEIRHQLSALTTSTNRAAAEGAAEALARLGPSGLAALTRVLADTSVDGEVRQWAAIALGKSGDETAALEPLTAALLDTSSEARHLPLAAAVALGALGTSGAAEALVEALAGPSEVYADAPAYWLIRIGTPAVPALLRVLGTGRVSQRRRAAFLLSLLRDARASTALIAALRDPEVAVRQEAARGLSRLGDAQATPALLPSLADPSPSVRRAAAFALGMCGGSEAVPALERLRNEDRDGDDEGAPVAEIAAWALDAIAARQRTTQAREHGSPHDTP
ncbi:MAG TPA: HEAT repeat domain-containing protein [Ktedonobacterales bacterium]|nr:HEAT repeat domain-containing protein [Ktedonobacterales bacterium]